MSDTREIFYHGMTIQDFFFAYYFFIHIPQDYDAKVQMRSLRNSFNFGPHIVTFLSQKNIERSSHKLIPGTDYLVKVFLTNKEKTFDECIQFFESLHNTAFVGPQGLAFLLTHYLPYFPIGRTAISLDRSTHLATFSDVPVVMGLHRRMHGALSFSLLDARLVDSYRFCFLCFARKMASDSHE